MLLQPCLPFSIHIRDVQSGRWAVAALGEACRARREREEVGSGQEEEVSGQKAEGKREIRRGHGILRSAAGIIPRRSLSPLGRQGGGVGGRWGFSDA